MIRNRDRPCYYELMLFWLCLAAPLLFWSISFVLGIGLSNYSVSQDTISSLAHTSHGPLQTANFIICGLAILWLAYSVRRYRGALHNAYLAQAGAWLLGASLILLGLLLSDPAGASSLAGHLHGAIFIGSVFAQAALQLTFALSNWPSGMSSYLVSSSAITALGLPMMLLFPDWKGITQRILVGAITLWVTLACFMLRPRRH